MSGALQTAASLIVVIGLILACAWALRGTQGFGLRSGSARHPLLRIVAAQALSARERVVLLECGDTWLVIGVAPGQVSRLARLPRPPVDVADSANGTATGTPSGALQPSGFAARLARVLQRT